MQCWSKPSKWRVRSGCTPSGDDVTVKFTLERGTTSRSLVKKGKRTAIQKLAEQIVDAIEVEIEQVGVGK